MIFPAIIFSWHCSVKKKKKEEAFFHQLEITTLTQKKKKEETQDSLTFRVKERVVVGGEGEFFGARAQGWVGMSEDDMKALVPARPMRKGMLGGWRETQISHQFCRLQRCDYV